MLEAARFMLGEGGLVPSFEVTSFEFDSMITISLMLDRDGS